MKKFKKAIMIFVSLMLSILMTSCTLFEMADSSSSSSNESSISGNSSTKQDSESESSSKKDSSDSEEDDDSNSSSSVEDDTDSDSSSSEEDNESDSSSSVEDNTDSDSSSSVEDDTESDSSSSVEDSTDSDSSSSVEDSTDSDSSSSVEDSTDEDSSSSDDGDIEEEPTPTYQVVKALNDENSTQKLIKTQYMRDSALVVDAIATDFGADPTGQVDSTDAIQQALRAAANLGGGTVFLPSGKYIVSGEIEVPDYVSLVGDWNKPNADNTDENFDYGTVIMARPEVLFGANPKDKPLFIIGNDAGIVGVTFYYMEQNATYIKNYGYTIYANAPATATFKNLTFINCTYGIGVSLNNIPNELVNIENVYGTFLYNAITHNGTTDVGFYDNIHISTGYWENAPDTYKCGDVSSMKSFVNSNLTAIVLGDLDDQLISNVTVDGGKVGIKFTTGVRDGAGFWGLIHKANLSCATGVYADYLNPVSGVVFTDSNVGVVENASSVGCIKMSNSTYTSAGTGRILKEGGQVASTEVATPSLLSFSTSERLFVANNLTSGGARDNTSALQTILNSVGEEGGIVVIPNGIYRLDGTVTIPKNVEIRSTQSIFSRSNHNQSEKNGVVFISYVTGSTFVLKEKAGVVGVRIWHAKNDFITAQNNLKGGVYTADVSIKADGAGAYAYLNESVGAYVGFDFSACDNHILKSNYGISYVNFIKAGGKDGVITQCLANLNFMARSNLYTYFDTNLSIAANWEKIKNSGETNDDFAVLRDDIGRTYTKMVRLENAENEVAFHVFAYGEAGLFDMVNSTATLINTSLDYIHTDKIVYELSGGRCDIIGSLRVYGISVKVNEGTMTAYGRIAHGKVKEKAYDSSVSLEDTIEYVSENAKRKTLFNCDSMSWLSAFYSSVTLNRDANYIKEGSGSWKWKSDTIADDFSSVDISEYKNGYLHFYVYCSDITKIGTQGQIEITSSGTCDVNEYSWVATQYITKTGWNDVWLDISSASVTGGEADLSAINYFRIYMLDATATFYIDNIEVVTD
ncbi:MAG: hypothetical protein IKA57_01970 [Clostridia bacterium]|nr:hypothetical protein [Clostridia bacterium]